MLHGIGFLHTAISYSFIIPPSNLLGSLLTVCHEIQVPKIGFLRGFIAFNLFPVGCKIRIIHSAVSWEGSAGWDTENSPGWFTDLIVSGHSGVAKRW